MMYIKTNIKVSSNSSSLKMIPDEMYSTNKKKLTIASHYIYYSPVIRLAIFTNLGLNKYGPIQYKETLRS